MVVEFIKVTKDDERMLRWLNRDEVQLMQIRRLSGRELCTRVTGASAMRSLVLRQWKECSTRVIL